MVAFLVSGLAIAGCSNSKNDPPRITSSPPLSSVLEDSTYAYTVTAVDDGPTITFSVAGANWLSVSGSVISGVPENEHVGISNVTVTASDGELTTTQSFAIEVINTNDLPVFTTTDFSGGEQWVSVTGQLFDDVDVGDSHTITVVENEMAIEPIDSVYTTSVGSLVISGEAYTFTPFSSKSSQLQVTVVDTSGTDVSTDILIAETIGDPLAGEQWHHDNRGQAAFSFPDELVAFIEQDPDFAWPPLPTECADLSATACQAHVAGFRTPTEDINTVGAITAGIRGQGVSVVVVDTGLEIAHPDLAANLVPGLSMDFLSGDDDPTNDLSVFGDHGTSVAGIVGSVGWNDIGGIGVAPEVGLAGMNFLFAQDDTSRAQTHGLFNSSVTVSDPVVAFNRSYGISYRIGPIFFPWNEFEAELVANTGTLRDGLGAINVKASGNAFDRFRRFLPYPDLDLPSHTAEGETYNAHMGTMVVGAVTAAGDRASYSTPGSSLFLSAPAGEYGLFFPAIVTTDQSGCERGYSRADEFWASLWPFNFGPGEDNENCDYTSSFNGTSSAAPMVSGVIALIASANPALDWRQIRHVLASTATQPEADDAAVIRAVGEGSFTAHLGWVQNAAGYWHNNQYGLGRPDASAAVETAMNAPVMGDLVEASSTWGPYHDPTTVAVPIPDGEAAGATIDVVLDDVPMDFTESVRVRLSVHATGLCWITEAYDCSAVNPEGSLSNSAGVDLAIELTSPSGTKGMLLSSNQLVVGEALVADHILFDTPMQASAFYGEDPNGTWRIRFVDVDATPVRPIPLPIEAYAVDIDEDGNLIYPEWLIQTADGQTTFYWGVNNPEPSEVRGIELTVFGHAQTGASE